MGALVMVAGEAGAGKTTLVRAFTQGLGDGTTVLNGACDPLTTPRPHGPLHDLAANPASGLGGLMEGEATPVERFTRVLATMRDRPGPTVVVIEDLHWADDGTLDLLRFVGRRIADTRGLVIAPTATTNSTASTRSGSCSAS